MLLSTITTVTISILKIANAEFVAWRTNTFTVTSTRTSSRHIRHRDTQACSLTSFGLAAPWTHTVIHACTLTNYHSTLILPLHEVISSIGRVWQERTCRIVSNLCLVFGWKKLGVKFKGRWCTYSRQSEELLQEKHVWKKPFLHLVFNKRRNVPFETECVWMVLN